MTKTIDKQTNFLSTRQAYGQALVTLGEKYPDLVVLDAGTSNSTFTDLFMSKFPKHYLKMFIAEQNAIGVATGISKQGYVPFVSTFAAFLSRAHDQLRMASYSQANIKVNGSHAGVSIGQDGASQMGLEDLAMFRSLFDSIVLYPSDAVSTVQLVQLAYAIKGLVYLRTTRAETPLIYPKNTKFTVPGLAVVKQSPQDRVAIIGAGITLHEALCSYKILKQQGINVRVIDLYCIKPLEVKLLTKALTGIKRVVTVEDHYPEGGLGEAVQSILTNHFLTFKKLAVKKMPKSGQPQELLTDMGIDQKAITTAVTSLL